MDPWVGKIPWRREWQPTPVFWSGESHGQRSLAGYSPRGPRVKQDLVINTFTKTGACFVKVLVFLYILSPTVHLIPSVNFFFGLSLPILCFFCFNHLPPSYFNTGFRYCSHHLGLSISTVGDWGIILPTREQICN